MHVIFYESTNLQIDPVGTDADIFPFVELGDRAGQDGLDAVVTIATQQDHRSEFFVLRDPLTLDDIYHNIDPFLRIARLVEVVG